MPQEVPPSVCFSCGTPQDPTNDTCRRCGAFFQSICKCGASVSRLQERCGSCGKPQRGRVGRPPLVRKVILRWSIAAVAVAAAAAAGVHWSRQKDSVWRLKDDALAKFNRGDLSGAAGQIEEYTRHFPRDAAGWYVLAASYRGLGMTTETWLAPARKAIECDPSHSEALMLLAAAAGQKGDLAEAVRCADAAARSSRASAASFELLANLLLQGERPDPARAAAVLEEARTRRLDTPLGRLRLAELRLRPYECLPAQSLPAALRGTLSDALDQSDELVGHDLDAAELALLKARLELALDEPSAAARRLEKAVAALPATAAPEVRGATRLLHGWSLWRTGAKPEARAEFAEALRASPSRAVAGELAERLSCSGDAAEAASQLGAVAATADPTGAVRSALAEILYEEGRIDDATAAVEAVLRVRADDVDALLLQGKLRWAQGRPDEARASWDAAARAAPGRADVLVERAMAPLREATDPAARRKAAAAALTELKAIAQTAGSAPAVLVAVGAADLEIGDAAAARTSLEEAVAASPTLAGAWSLLAQALAAQGRNDDAVRACAKARQLRPDDDSLACDEARLRVAAGEPADAVMVCSGHLQRRPDALPVLRARAAAYRALSRWSAAADDLARVETGGGADDETYRLLVDSEFRAGRADRAEATAQRALRVVAPATAERLRFLCDLYQRGQAQAVGDVAKAGPTAFLVEVLLATGQVDPAMAAAREILARDPHDAEVARLLIHALLQSSSPDAAATKEARRVVDALGDSGDSTSRDAALGRVLLAEGDASGAAARLETASWARPGDALIRFYLGEARLAVGDRDGGLASLRDAVTLPGALPGMAKGLARALVRASIESVDLRRAEDMADEASRVDPSSAAAALRLVALLRGRGDCARAGEEAVRALAEHRAGTPEAVALRDQAVVSWIAAGNADRAQSLVDSADAEYRTRAAARLLAGFIELRAGRMAQAESAFAAIAAGGADQPLATIGLVQCALRRGDVPAATSAVAAWERAFPQDRDVRLSAVHLLLSAGHAAEARTVAAACRDAHPADPRAAAMLVRVLFVAGSPTDAVAEADRLAAAAGPDEKTDAALLAGVTRLQCAGDVAGALATARGIASASNVGVGAEREAHVLEAEALLAMGRDDEARRAASAVTAAWVGDMPATAADRALEGRVRFVLGTLAARAGLTSLATGHLERCLAVDSLNFAAANNLACVLLQDPAGLPRATKLARWITEAQPKEPNFWDTRAQCAAKAHDGEDAVASWRRAVAGHGAAWTDAKAGVELRLAEFLAGNGGGDEASKIAGEILASRPTAAVEARAKMLVR